MIEKLVLDFLVLWATIDPISTLALFAALTGSVTSRERRRIAGVSILFAGGAMLFALIAGQLILAGMGVRLLSLQVAGGVILFLFALSMIFTNPESSFKQEEGHDIAVFPIAIPSIATPGAIMAVILLTDNHIYSFSDQLLTAGVLIIVLAITYVFMLLSDHIISFMGKNGCRIVVKMMGMLLAAFSVELIMEAIGIEQWIVPEPDITMSLPK